MTISMNIPANHLKKGGDRMDIQGLIDVAFLVAGFVLAALTFGRNRDKDVKGEAAKLAVIETKLTDIGNGVDSIRIDIKAQEKRVNDLSDKVIVINESLKSLHKRVDSIERGE